MEIKYINRENFRRRAALVLAGTLVSCVLTISANKDFSVNNEFSNGIYYDEDVKRNINIIIDRIRRGANDKEKVLEKGSLSSKRGMKNYI